MNINRFRTLIILVLIILSSCSHYKTSEKTNEPILQPRVLKGTIDEISKIAYEAAKKAFPEAVANISVLSKYKITILREWFWRGDTIITISIDQYKPGEFIINAESMVSWHRLNPSGFDVSKDEIANYFQSLDEQYESYIREKQNKNIKLNGLADKLDELKKAFDSGLIDQNEYEQKRKEILNEFRSKTQTEYDSNVIKSVGLPNNIAEQQGRVKSFLFRYCDIYESKDFDKFTSLFTSDATENGNAFNEQLPKYRKNFEMVELFNYRIELDKYSFNSNTGDVRIKGRYFTQYLIDGKLNRTSGNISMELIESGDSYLVKELNYSSPSEKEADKQPQWGPWIKVKDKE